MSLLKIPVWSAVSTLVKVITGLLIVKSLTVLVSPTGIRKAGNFKQLITVLNVLSSIGIYDGITKYVAQHHSDVINLQKVISTSSTIVQGFFTLMALFFIKVRYH